MSWVLLILAWYMFSGKTCSITLYRVTDDGVEEILLENVWAYDASLFEDRQEALNHFLSMKT